MSDRAVPNPAAAPVASDMSPINLVAVTIPDRFRLHQHLRLSYRLLLLMPFRYLLIFFPRS